MTKIGLRARVSALGLAAGLSVSVASAATDYAAEPEYRINYSLAAINAAAAFTRGYTGQGVIVAVLDSGIDRSNPDLQGKVLGGYSFLTNSPYVSSDTVGHGTFVSGIIAAARNGWGVEGIAFNSTILPEQIINSAGSVSVSDSQLAQAIAYGFNSGARIFNNSWNSSTTITQVSANQVWSFSSQSVSMWEKAVAKGALVVFAAGNNSTAQVGYLAGLPALFPQLKPGWIAAVATDATGAIASYSDRCGIAAAWCMAAPGSNIYSTYKSGLGIGSGTSFAAPAIAAAAADLLQEFPYLTAAQVGQILLKTANKTGIYTDSATYGQGLLDLNAATKPVGTTSIPTGSSVNGSAVMLANSGAAFGGAFGFAFRQSIGSILVLDSFQRGYQIDGAALVGSQSANLDIRDTLNRFGNEDLAEIAPGVKAAFAPTNPAAPATATRMRMQITGRDGSVFETSIGTNPALGFGNLASGALPADALVIEDGVANPYLNLAEAGMTARAMLPHAMGAASLNLGLFEGYSRSSALGVRMGDPSYAPPRVAGAVAEAALPVQGGRIAFDLGMLVEQGSFLASTTSGAFGALGDTPTTFVGINAETEIRTGLTLFANYRTGRSSPSVSSGALVTSYGAVRTESFAVGLVQKGVAASGDSIGLVLSEPLRITGGNATLDVPFARDFDGNVLSHTVNAPLGARGRELDIQAFYAGRLTRDVKFDAGMVTRVEPNNQSAAPADVTGLVKVKMGF